MRIADAIAFAGLASLGGCASTVLPDASTEDTSPGPGHTDSRLPDPPGQDSAPPEPPDTGRDHTDTGALLPDTGVDTAAPPDTGQPLDSGLDTDTPPDSDPPSPPLSPLMISEVMVDPPPCAAGNSQYIEVWNRSGAPLDLSGALIASRHDTFTVPTGTYLSTNGRAVFATDAQAFVDCFGVAPSVLLTTGVSWRLDDDVVQVVAPAHAVVEGFAWSAQRPALAPAEATAWELDEANPSSYCLAVEPVGLTDALGSPGQPNPPCGGELSDTGLEDTDTCQVHAPTYGPPNPPAPTQDVASLWGVGWRSTLRDGELTDYATPIGAGAVDERPPTLVVELYGPSINYLCRIEYTILSQQPADAQAWPIISGLRTPTWAAWDVEVSRDDGRSTCPRTLTVQPYNGGPARTLAPLTHFQGSWRIGVGALQDIKTTLQPAVANAGADWANDWEPYVVSGFVGDPGGGFELSYGFLYEETCQVPDRDPLGRNVPLAAPVGPPIPDAFLDIRVYRVISF